MKTRFAAALALIVAVAGCVYPAQPKTKPPYEYPATISSQEQCEALGGRWGPGGFLQEHRCLLKMKDAGKTCHDNNDCESACVAPNNARAGDRVAGHCFEYNDVRGGCRAYVENGRAKPEVCID